MKLLCSNLILFLFLLLSKVSGREIPAGVALYYAENPPKELFINEWVILDPDVVDLEKINKRRAKVFAYVSIGEIAPFRYYYKEIKKEWIIGENIDWKTEIVDLRRTDYRKFLLEKVLKNITLEGFDGFLFDTLDSYQLVLKKTEERKEYETSIVEFIKEVKNAFPGKKIIINRGFEIIDNVHSLIDGFLAESLFYGIDTKKMTYKKMSKQESEWLIKKLMKVQKYNIPIIIVDYLPPKERKAAKILAEKITKLGFIPWITSKNLDTIGIGSLEIVRRKILLLYDGRAFEDVAFTSVHRLAQMPLEFLGYLPVLWDVNKGLPEGTMVDKYAGIIIWLEQMEVKNYQKFYKWILSKIEEGNKLLFIDSFGFPLNETYLKELGIEVFENLSEEFDKTTIIYKDKVVGFEAEPVVAYSKYLLKPMKDKGKPLLLLRNSKGQEFAPIALTEWGGYAMLLSAVTILFGDALWTVNPFEFFKLALELDEIPAPDITTENGRRILFCHIDGDSFTERAEWDTSKFASEIIRDEILKVFTIPHTVSVIEGEIAPHGLYPELSEKLEQIARSIFKLENVEPASHSFSHPYKWRKISLELKENVKGHSFPIKNYTFNIEREISGSVEYIENRLLPGKKKVKVFLWTGDCIPSTEAVKMTYNKNLLNLNGGYTTITEDRPWISRISPLGIDRDGYFQVYTAAINRNFYTGDWTYPFYGHIKVIETFKLTNEPIRLKPINIYYHFYSGSKIASLKALKEVYKWALSQEIIPMFASDWIKRVLDSRNLTIAIYQSGWLLNSDKDLRTVRMKKEMGFPCLKKSRGVVGYKEYKDYIYIHLDGSGDYYLLLEKDEKPMPMLYDANLLIKEFRRTEDGFYLYLSGYVPAEFRLKNIDGYDLYLNVPYSKKVQNGLITFKSESKSVKVYVREKRKK